MEKLRTLQVGCGGISGAWIRSPSYRDMVDLRALVDLNPDTAANLRQRMELPEDLPIYTDLEEAIAAEQPEAVFDTTVPAAHHVVTTTALAKGCHVLGEKPMAETMDQAKAMVAASISSGRTYAVTQTRRWASGIEHLSEVLEDGRIGEAHTVFAEFVIAAHFGGFRETMDHVLLLDMAIHSFDSARQILGDPDPAWVQAYEWNPSGSRYRHGANAVATFGFANGAVFSYQGTWTASGVQTDWCCDWRIQASAGAAQLSRDLGMRVERLRDPDEPSAADGGPLIRSLDPLPVPTHEDGPNVRNGHNEAIADFVTAIRHERKPRCHAAENIKSLAMVHAAVEAAESGRREVVSW